MGLFDDAGINPDELAIGKLKKGIYDFIISNVEVKNSKAGDPYLVFSYTTPDYEYPVQDWFRILPTGKTLAMCDDTDDSFNVYTTAKNVTVRQTEKKFFTVAYRNIKRRLMDFGVDEARVNSIDPTEVKGMALRIAISESDKNDFPIIDKISVPGSSGMSLPAAPVMHGMAPGAPVIAQAVAPTDVPAPIATAPIATAPVAVVQDLPNPFAGM